MKDQTNKNFDQKITDDVWQSRRIRAHCQTDGARLSGLYDRLVTTQAATKNSAYADSVPFVIVERRQLQRCQMWRQSAYTWTYFEQRSGQRIVFDTDRCGTDK